MKFSQMPYMRPVLDETVSLLSSHVAALENATTQEEAVNSYMAADAILEHVNSLGTIAYIRYSQDTKDQFFSDEQAYFDEISPLLQEPVQRMERALLASPFRSVMEERFGALMFQNLEISLRTFKPEITADLQAENKLSTEYRKLLASAQISYDGKTLTLAQMMPYLQNTDAAVRREARDKCSEWFISHNAEFDNIYNDLVALRTGIAAKLSYPNFVGLGYDRMKRNCYSEADVAKFREGVSRYIVPVAERFKQQQAKRIGVPKLTVYDDAFEFPSGNAKPFGTPEQIFEQGQKMYRELSAETGEFFDFMLENELFDVLTRPGKSGGGFCADIPDYKSSFIFANFNGTSGDIDVLTHEAGHAFAGYTSRNMKPSPLRDYTYETAEVHSMSMEFFTWPWMDKFFTEHGKYRYSHLSSALTFIPYGTMVDDFQSKVYAEPDMTPAQRNDLWKGLEGQYRPWLDISAPFFNEGRRWQYQAHIYERPFYYIDYCLAQTVALAFWAEAQRDHKSAWSKYLKFVGYAGTKTFSDAIASCGLPNPFEWDTLKKIADTAAEWLDGQPEYK